MAYATKAAAEFEFFHAVDRSTVLGGFVLLRGKEMLLDIEEPDDTPWDIHGKAKGAFFEGEHKPRLGDISGRLILRTTIWP
jgi:hypothetical protein